MNDLLKKLLPALLLVCLCAPVLGQSRIATVDWTRVFEGYWKTKQAVAQFKDRVADMDKELAGMVEELKKADEQYKKLLEEANAPAISSEVKCAVSTMAPRPCASAASRCSAPSRRTSLSSFSVCTKIRL